MCNIYITEVHYFEIHFSMQESVFSRWMYQVFWWQRPQRRTWHALLGIRALDWNSFLYIPPFQLYPLLAGVYPWEQMVEGLLNSPYAVQYHSFSGMAAAG